MATPIWDRANAADIAQFANTPYVPALEKMQAFMVSNGKNGLPPEKLGEAVKTALTVSRPKTRYPVTPNPVRNLIFSRLPKRILDNMVARRLGLI